MRALKMNIWRETVSGGAKEKERGREKRDAQIVQRRVSITAGCYRDTFIKVMFKSKYNLLGNKNFNFS